MSSVISASTTSTTALTLSGDTSGQLEIKTGASPTTAITIDTSQNVGIGTSSFSLASTGRGILEINGTSDSAIGFKAGNTLYGYLYNSASEFRVANITANPINFYTNNTERMRITANGGLCVGTTTDPGGGNINLVNNGFYGWGGLDCLIGGTSAASGYIYFRTGATERMRIDSSGNVGIGTSSPGAKLDVVGSAGIRVNEDGAGTKVITIRSNYAGVDPAINVTTNNSLLFLTNNTERMRVLSTGNILSLSGGSTTATGTGIAFPATQSASSDANTLDDYEEGTFNPNVIGTSTAGTVSYGDRSGKYTKIGNKVFYTIYMTWTSGTGTGNLQITGLPFTSANNGEYPTAAVYTNDLNYTSGNTITCYIGPNNTILSVLQSVPNSGAIAVPYDANVSGFIISGFYTTA